MATTARSKRSAGKTRGTGRAVENFVERLGHPRTREILALRSMIRGVDPHIAESIKWNAPSLSTVEHFATFQLRRKDLVQVVLHLGAAPRPDLDLRDAISDPTGLLDWRGRDRAIVTFRDQADIDSKGPAFVAILRRWITFVR